MHCVKAIRSFNINFINYIKAKAGALWNFSLTLACIAVMVLLSCAPVAQLDRALDYGSKGLGFESLRARQLSIHH